MALFKKKISEEDYLKSLLDLRKKIDGNFQTSIKNWFVQENVSFNLDEKHLKYDIVIFTLWIVSLTIQSDKCKNKFHSLYCKDVGLVENEMIDVFYDDINLRYENYYYGYNLWAKNHKNGTILSNIFTEIILKQNAGYSYKTNPLPTNNFTFLNLNIFAFFAESSKQTYEFKSNLEQKFKVPNFN